MLLKITKLKHGAEWIRAALGALIILLSAQTAFADPCDIRNNAPDFIRHDLAGSYCELCGYGLITIVIANPYEEVDLTHITVTENLGTSGLTFAPGAPSPISVNGCPAGPGAAPTISGPNGSILTWTAAQIPALARLAYDHGFNFNTLAITFAVSRSSSLSQEGLVSAVRSIQARMTYSTEGAEICFPGTATVNSDIDTLPLREPIPDVVKSGRNVDANQGGWTQTVYGNQNDDVIWRIRVNNSGSADLQDLRFDDLMEPGNAVITLCLSHSRRCCRHCRRQWRRARHPGLRSGEQHDQ